MNLSHLIEKIGPMHKMHGRQEWKRLLLLHTLFMATIRTYIVYKFDELSEEGKKKALEKLWDINVDDSYWYETNIDNRKEDLAKIGFEDAKIFFSGFSSQGDGASFECTVDLKKWFDARPMNKQSFPALASDVADSGNYHCSIKKSGRYEHEMTMSIDSRYYGENENAEKELGALEEVILEDARDEARDIYRELEKEYDYCTSEEAITETIKANDYDFTEDGKID